MRKQSVAETFADSLRTLLEGDVEAAAQGWSYVAGKAIDDYDAVFLYKEFPGGPILGRRFDLRNLGELFAPVHDARELAHIIYDSTILDPTGRGEVLDVDWADGLGIPRNSIQWVGVGHWLP